METPYVPPDEDCGFACGPVARGAAPGGRSVGFLSGLLGIITIGLNTLNRVMATINSTLRNVIGPILQGINSAISAAQQIMGEIFDFERNIVYPQQAINSARGLIGQALAAGSGDGFGRVSSAMGSAEGGGSVAAAGSSGASPTAPAAPVAVAGTPAPSSVASGGGQAPGGPGSGGGRGIGNWRVVIIPHSVGWLAGAAAAIGVQGGQGALNAGRSLIARATGIGADSESK